MNSTVQRIAKYRAYLYSSVQKLQSNDYERRLNYAAHIAEDDPQF